MSLPLPAIGNYLVLEELSTELGNLNLPKDVSAIYRNVVAKIPSCPGKGGCCMRGIGIPCTDIFPHQDGVVVERDGLYLLNGVTVLNDFTPHVEKIEIDRSNGDRRVLGWIVNDRINNAIRHPRGAIIIKEVSMLPDFTGMSVSLLLTH